MTEINGSCHALVIDSKYNYEGDQSGGQSNTNIYQCKNSYENNAHILVSHDPNFGANLNPSVETYPLIGAICIRFEKY